jgi:hypothetical protein
MIGMPLKNKYCFNMQPSAADMACHGRAIAPTQSPSRGSISAKSVNGLHTAWPSRPGGRSVEAISGPIRKTTPITHPYAAAPAARELNDFAANIIAGLLPKRHLSGGQTTFQLRL